MGLDEETRRFAFLMQRDLRGLAEKRAAREERGEELRYDSVSRLATVESRRGDVVARLYGETLATWTPRDRIFRWAWAGRSSATAVTHSDLVFREGQARGVPQLAMSVVGGIDLEEARTLASLGALVSQATSIHERSAGGDVEFVGLFQRPRPTEAAPERAGESRFSVPPPPVAEAPHRPASSPPAAAYRSLPPIREIYAPRTGGSRPPGAPVRPGGVASGSGSDRGRAIASSPPSSPPAGASAASPASPASPAPAASPASPASPAPAALRRVREPSRALFLPVATIALAALARASQGYVQGLFVVVVDTVSSGGSGDDKRRLSVQLVVIDAAGLLRSLDPPNDLVEAAAFMVDADQREGNGTWRKLSARVTPKADGGATLHVEVI